VIDPGTASGAIDAPLASLRIGKASPLALHADRETKVVHFLGRRGFLDNLRGRGGGLRLAMPAAAGIGRGAAAVRCASGTIHVEDLVRERRSLARLLFSPRVRPATA
jgi:hypothetical protein